MAKKKADPLYGKARKWKHHVCPCVPKAKQAAANAAIATWGEEWGPNFFSIPLRNPGGQIVEYTADVVLNDTMLAKLKTLPANVLRPQDIEVPTTTAKGQARLKEIATKRNLTLKTEV